MPLSKRGGPGDTRKVCADGCFFGKGTDDRLDIVAGILGGKRSDHIKFVCQLGQLTHRSAKLHSGMEVETTSPTVRMPEGA